MPDPIKLLSSHGLTCSSIEKTPIGFTNDVYLTPEYAVKCYRSREGFERELWFYRHADAPYAPKLIAWGEGYIILRRIAAHGLYHYWPGLTDARREALVARIARLILHLNAVDISGAAQLFPAPSDWQQHITGSILKSLDALTAQQALPEGMAERIRNYTLLHSGALAPQPYVLCYADLHFDKLMLSPQDELYLLDYETLQLAPADYVLDVWDRMTVHPFIYANEEDDPFAVAQDYRSILVWLKKYAPQLFNAPDLEHRLALYGLKYDLRQLESFPGHPLLLERIERSLMR